MNRLDIFLEVSNGQSRKTASSCTQGATAIVAALIAFCCNTCTNLFVVVAFNLNCDAFFLALN